MHEEGMTTAEVAERVGVHKDTLLRWLREGLIPEPARNHFNWRMFSNAEVEAAVRFATRKEPLPAEAVHSLEQLRKIDWGFDSAKTNYLTHSIHPYPAKFIPQIPNALIQELSSVGDTILDPFTGSGTTLVEALLLHRNAIGIDANPIACLISKCKTSEISAKDVERLDAFALETEALATARGELAIQPQLFTAAGLEGGDHPLLTSPDIEFWFPEVVAEELAHIVTRIEHFHGTAALAAKVALSAIIVAVSKQDSDTRYVRREKKIQPGETLARFSRSLRSVVSSLTRLKELVDTAKVDVIQADVLTCPKIPKVDLVVTSPPYPNAYSYHLYHRTRMAWLGLDQPTFKKVEIGSHRKFSRRIPTKEKLEVFEQEFSTVAGYLYQALKKGGYCCFIVGDSTIDGKRIDTAELLSQIFQRSGFSEMDRLGRTIKRNRKSFNPVIGKIKTEKILILRK